MSGRKKSKKLTDTKVDIFFKGIAVVSVLGIFLSAHTFLKEYRAERMCPLNFPFLEPFSGVFLVVVKKEGFNEFEYRNLSAEILKLVI